MKKKILSGFLTLVAMMTISTGSVFAQDLIKSTPSRADDVTAGEDVTQGKKTEYAESESISDTTYESDKVVYIYATETSNVVISLPVNTTLSACCSGKISVIRISKTYLKVTRKVRLFHQYTIQHIYLL